MAENNETKVTEVKKENKFVKFIKKNGWTILACTTAFAAGALAGYTACTATHHEPNDDTIEKVDNVIDAVTEPEIADNLADQAENIADTATNE